MNERILVSVERGPGRVSEAHRTGTASANPCLARPSPPAYRGSRRPPSSLAAGWAGGAPSARKGGSGAEVRRACGPVASTARRAGDKGHVTVRHEDRERPTDAGKGHARGCSGFEVTVLVVGATGVLGHALVPRLIASGHNVRAIAVAPRPPSFQPESSRSTLICSRTISTNSYTGATPSFTSRPLSRSIRLGPRGWDRTARLRTVGTRRLLDATLACHVRALCPAEHRHGLPGRRRRAGWTNRRHSMTRPGGPLSAGR